MLYDSGGYGFMRLWVGLEFCRLHGVCSFQGSRFTGFRARVYSFTFCRVCSLPGL